MSRHQQSVSAVLFDADGVIQMTDPDWRQAWAQLIESPGRVDEFMSAIFKAEKPFLAGGDGFADAVAVVLAEWNCPELLEDALQLWQMIEPDAGVLELIRNISANGIETGLATNQQSHRIEFMRTGLGYDELFDQIFVSCEMGVTKPSHAYFEKILFSLDYPAEEVIFIDDHDANVAAARDLGIRGYQFHLDQGIDVLRDLLPF